MLSKHDLEHSDELQCKALINDIQDLIWALNFEKGPKPKGSFDNKSKAFMFFEMIEKPFLKPLSWQKIKVAAGPKNQTMYQVLKEAKAAVENLNLNRLVEIKERQKGQYDLVQPLLGEKKSISAGRWIDFDILRGTIKNQPGFHVHTLLGRVDELIKKNDVDLHQVQVVP